MKLLLAALISLFSIGAFAQEKYVIEFMEDMDTLFMSKSPAITFKTTAEREYFLKDYKEAKLALEKLRRRNLGAMEITSLHFTIYKFAVSLPGFASRKALNYRTQKDKQLFVEWSEFMWEKIVRTPLVWNP